MSVPVTGFRAHSNLVWSHFDLIICAKNLFSSKVTFWVCRRVWILGRYYWSHANAHMLCMACIFGAMVIKNLPANSGGARDVGLIPESRRSSGGGNGNPLHYSCLENLMDGRAWQATVYRVAKSQTRLSNGRHRHPHNNSFMMKWNSYFKETQETFKNKVFLCPFGPPPSLYYALTRPPQWQKYLCNYKDQTFFFWHE